MPITEKRCTYCRHRSLPGNVAPCDTCWPKSVINGDFPNFEPQPTEQAPETPIGEIMGGE